MEDDKRVSSYIWKYGKTENLDVLKFIVLKSVKYIRTHNDIMFLILKKKEFHMLNVLFPWSHCVKIEVKIAVIVTIKMINRSLFLNGHRTLWFSSDMYIIVKQQCFVFYKQET